MGLARYPLTEFLWLAGWTLASVGLLIALRGEWYSPHLFWAVPLLDAVVLWIAANRFRYAPTYGGDVLDHPGVLGLFAVLAALLAISGAFRLTRRGAWLSTALAVAAFAAAAATTGVHTAHTLGILVVLLIIGSIGADVAHGHRRRSGRTDLQTLLAGSRADGRGLGLGLAITRGIVEAHGGRIAGREPSREGEHVLLHGPDRPRAGPLGGSLGRPDCHHCSARAKGRGAGRYTGSIP